MSRIVWLRIVLVIAVSVALAGTPESASAQRGGHGGGGGFHGGGGGGGFHGGGGGFHGGGGFGGFRGGAGGFHGGNFGGFHGGGFHGRGFGGFHGGGFRGRPFFGGFGFPGYGYGLSFGFGFGPYWGYPYSYGYGPWSPYGYYPYSPYYYPDYYPDGPDYPRDNRNPRDNRDDCDYRHEDAHPDACKPNNENAPAKPSSTVVPESSPESNYMTTNPADDRSAVSLAEFRSAAPNNPATATTAEASNYHLSDSAGQQPPSGLRPAVKNVIQALRAMPPEAQQRQLNSGRYRSLSPEEREFLTTEVLSNATQPPQASAQPTAR
jgi:hypothetical protein